MVVATLLDNPGRVLEASAISMGRGSLKGHADTLWETLYCKVTFNASGARHGTHLLPMFVGACCLAGVVHDIAHLLVRFLRF